MGGFFGGSLHFRQCTLHPIWCMLAAGIFMQHLLPCFIEIQLAVCKARHAWKPLKWYRHQHIPMQAIPADFKLGSSRIFAQGQGRVWGILGALYLSQRRVGAEHSPGKEAWDQSKTQHWPDSSGLTLIAGFADEEILSFLHEMQDYPKIVPFIVCEMPAWWQNGSAKKWRLYIACIGPRCSLKAGYRERLLLSFYCLLVLQDEIESDELTLLGDSSGLPQLRVRGRKALGWAALRKPHTTAWACRSLFCTSRLIQMCLKSYFYTIHGQAQELLEH